MEAAGTAQRATMVAGYRHVPGHHCGSTALRNLLGFHGLRVSEEMAFGLGAGPCFYYIVLDGQSPSRFTTNRTVMTRGLPGPGLRPSMRRAADG